MVDFSERLSKLLEIYGYSQKEFAAMIGTTEAAVSRYLNNERIPRLALVVKMAEVFHTSVDYISCGSLEHTDFDEVYGLVCINAKNFTEEQKLKIIKTLVS